MFKTNQNASMNLVHVTWMWKGARPSEISSRGNKRLQIYFVECVDTSCLVFGQSFFFLFPYDGNAEFFSAFTKWRISNSSPVVRYNHHIRWPGKHVTRWDGVILLLWLFNSYRNHDSFFFFFAFCKIVLIDLSTKMNEHHQVDMVDMFQSKDFALHMLLVSSFFHILYLLLPCRVFNNLQRKK